VSEFPKKTPPKGRALSGRIKRRGSRWLPGSTSTRSVDSPGDGILATDRRSNYMTQSILIEQKEARGNDLSWQLAPWCWTAWLTVGCFDDHRCECNSKSSLGITRRGIGDLSSNHPIWNWNRFAEPYWPVRERFMDSANLARISSGIPWQRGSPELARYCPP
jgi:hypothetical protein